DLAIAVLELGVEIGEALDLGRTHEGEVLRVEEHAKPFVLVGAVVDLGESLVEVFDGHGGFQVEMREVVADGKHGKLLWGCRDWVKGLDRRRAPRFKDKIGPANQLFKLIVAIFTIGCIY